MTTPAQHIVKLLEDRTMDLVESFSNFPLETKTLNENTWRHLLVYVPKEALEARLARLKENENIN